MARNLPEQCRTCLLKKSEMISLMADHVVCEKVMSVLELIKTCTSAQIEFEDGYPQYVCLDCIHLAEKSYEFRIQCEKVDNSLRANIDNICEIVESTEVDSDDNHTHYDVLEPEFETESTNETTEVDYLNLLESKDDIKCEEVDLGDTSFSCFFCDLIFPSSTALSKHTSITHQPKFYQCPLCSVRFITRELLNKHITKHDGNKVDKVGTIRNKQKRRVDYTCAVCGKKYATLGSLNIHIRKHSPDKRQLKSNNPVDNTIFICHDCDHHFVSANDLQMHMETMHNLKSEETNKYQCRYCYKICTNSDMLREHLENTHNKKKKPVHQNKVSYKCKICLETAKSLQEIKDHLSIHDINSKDLFNHLSYLCTDCDQGFNTIYDYFAHSSSVHGGSKAEHGSSSGNTRVIRKRPYKCNVPDCGKSFPSPSALKKHSISHESQWPKKCRYCDTFVNKWHEYMIHLNNNHDDKKTFICSQCGKKFFKERNLQSHIKTHTGERNYMCDFCGFSFQAQNNLVAHRRIHTGVKPYKCTYCPQAFAQHAGLRSHLLNHNGEKKHECPTCLKKFLRIGALRNHIKTHTGVKDYACHICGARFGASSTRKKHLLTHTGERNHICDFCGKAFSRRSNLSVHRKIHTGETPHVCEVCGKGFIQAHVLKSHMNTHKKRGEIDIIKNTRKLDKSNNSAENITVLVEFNNE